MLATCITRATPSSKVRCEVDTCRRDGTVEHVMTRGIVKIGVLFLVCPPKLWYSQFLTAKAKNCRYLQECATISFQAPIGQTLFSPYACTKVCMCIISQGSQSPKEVSVGSCTYVVEQRTFLQSFQIQARPVIPQEKLGYFKQHFHI